MNFNPFKKRNEAEKKKREADRAAEESAVEAMIATADSIDEPAEKIIALRRVRAELGNMIWQQHADIEKTAHEKGLRAGMAAMAPMAAGGAAAMALITGPLGVLGLVTMYGGLIAGAGVEKKRAKGVRANLEKDAAGHIQYLGDRIGTVTAMMETTVAEHVQEIAKSPRNAEVMQDITLAKVFAEAAAKQLVAKDEEVTALKEAQAKAAAEAGPDFKKGYQKLADVMKPPGEKKSRKKQAGPKQG